MGTWGLAYEELRRRVGEGDRETGGPKEERLRLVKVRCEPKGGTGIDRRVTETERDAPRLTDNRYRETRVLGTSSTDPHGEGVRDYCQEEPLGSA